MADFAAAAPIQAKQDQDKALSSAQPASQSSRSRWREIAMTEDF